jgi:hypothetical protein
MNKLFNRRSKKQDARTLHIMKQTLDSIIKLIASYEAKKVTYIKDSVELSLNKNKKEALWKLKQTKKIDKIIDQLYDKRYIIEIQIFTLESNSIDSQVIKCIKLFSQTLKLNNFEVNIFDNIILEAQEAIDDAIAYELSEEINQLLPQPLSLDNYNEDELMKELEELTKRGETPKDTNTSVQLTNKYQHSWDYYRLYPTYNLLLPLCLNTDFPFVYLSSNDRLVIAPK